MAAVSTPYLMTSDDAAWRRRGPTPAAVRAFGVDDQTLHRLEGGQGLAWTDGRLVLKPVGCRPEHDFLCRTYVEWPTDAAVRVPRPVEPRDGSSDGWSVDGWGAHVWVPGRSIDFRSELATVRAVSKDFHALLAGMPRPAFLDTRDDPWSYGDRLAWEDAAPVADSETRDLINRLRERLAPVTSPEQVIHGDILGNILLHEQLPPAVIDWPPYFRPAAMGEAIAITDAVTFHGAPIQLLDEWATGPDWQQLLIRSLLYRLGPTAVFERHRRLMGILTTHLEKVRPVVDYVLSRSDVDG